MVLVQREHRLVTRQKFQSVGLSEVNGPQSRVFLEAVMETCPPAPACITEKAPLLDGRRCMVTSQPSF